MIVEKIDSLPDEIDVLIDESLREGFGAVSKLKSAYLKGSNIFSNNGEGLFAAYSQNNLVGICGLNIDPYLTDSSIGRLRHLYVLTKYRKQGFGTLLVEAAEQIAIQNFTLLRLYTSDKEASLFYQRIGYTLTEGEHVSHTKQLKA